MTRDDGFGVIDLDLPIAAESDLPSVADALLPAVAEHADLPALADESLPMLADHLPVAVPHGDLPEPHLDDLPLPAHDDLPVLADLPQPDVESEPPPPSVPPYCGSIEDEDSFDQITDGFESGIRHAPRTRMVLLAAPVLIAGAAMTILTLQPESNEGVRHAAMQRSARIESASAAPQRDATTSDADRSFALGRAKLQEIDGALDALRHFQRAAQASPGNADHHAWVAVAANALERRGEARLAIDRALALDDTNVVAHWQLAELHLRGNQPGAALKALARAGEGLPDIHATAARCHEMLSDHEAAIASWRKAIASQRDVAAWHYRLGDLLRRHATTNVDREAAQQHLSRAEVLALALPVSQRPRWLPRLRSIRRSDPSSR